MCSHNCETKTGDIFESWYIKEVFVLNHDKIMNDMIQIKVHKKKKYRGSRCNKWGENPNNIATDTNTEGNDKIMDTMIQV